MPWGPKKQTEPIIAPRNIDYGEVNVDLSRIARADLQIIVQSLTDLVLSGIPNSRLISSVMTMMHVSYGVAQTLVDKTIETMEEDILLYIKRETPMSIARRNDLYNKSYELQDFKTCLAIQQDIDKLRGNYARNGEGNDVDTLAQFVDALEKAATSNMEITEEELLGIPFNPDDIIEGDEEEDVSTEF
jgi:hypothetical protein